MAGGCAPRDLALPAASWWRQPGLACSFLGRPIRVKLYLTPGENRGQGVLLPAQTTQAPQTWYLFHHLTCCSCWGLWVLQVPLWTLNLGNQLIYVNTAAALSVTVKDSWKEAVSTGLIDYNCIEVGEVRTLQVQSQIFLGYLQPLNSHVLPPFVCDVTSFVTNG